MSRDMRGDTMHVSAAEQCPLTQPLHRYERVHGLIGSYSFEWSAPRCGGYMCALARLLSARLWRHTFGCMVTTMPWVPASGQCPALYDHKVWAQTCTNGLSHPQRASAVMMLQQTQDASPSLKFSHAVCGTQMTSIRSAVSLHRHHSEPFVRLCEHLLFFVDR